MTKDYSVAKWMIAIAVSLITVNHVLMTAIYLSPPNLLQKMFGRIAYQYMSSLFYQNWHLFSPQPGITSTKIAVRCRDPRSGWSVWFDPLENLYAEHYRYRVLGHGKILYVYREIATGLERELQSEQAECLQHIKQPSEAVRCGASAIMQTVQQSPPYKVAKRFAERTCQTYGEDLRSAEIQFKVLEFFPLKYSERSERNKRWSHVDEVAFPSFAPSVQDR